MRTRRWSVRRKNTNKVRHGLCTVISAEAQRRRHGIQRVNDMYRDGSRGDRSLLVLAHCYTNVLHLISESVLRAIDSVNQGLA